MQYEVVEHNPTRLVLQQQTGKHTVSGMLTCSCTGILLIVVPIVVTIGSLFFIEATDTGFIFVVPNQENLSFLLTPEFIGTLIMSRLCWIVPGVLALAIGLFFLVLGPRQVIWTFDRATNTITHSAPNIWGVSLLNKRYDLHEVQQACVKVEYDEGEAIWDAVLEMPGKDVSILSHALTPKEECQWKEEMVSLINRWLKGENP